MTGSKPASQDRRDFYRISDNIAISYTLMPADFVAPTQDPIDQEDTVAHRLLSDLQTMDADTKSTLQNLKDRDAKICLESLNKKIDLMARYIAAHISSQNMHFETVNISGGGLQFPVDKAMAINRTLKLELLLYPSCANIVAYANVVNCVKSEDKLHYDLSAQFIKIREADRDALIRHVLQRQASQIREEKTQNER